MKDKLIVKFKLSMLDRLSLVESIVCLGYQATGNKFSFHFNGSKGYLSNVVISCEGTQAEDNNVIWVERFRTVKGSLKNVMVSIFHSEEKGVRIELNGRATLTGLKH